MRRLGAPSRRGLETLVVGRCRRDQGGSLCIVKKRTCTHGALAALDRCGLTIRSMVFHGCVLSGL